MSEQKTPARTPTRGGNTLTSSRLTACDGELAAPERGALGLVEGEVVEGGGHVHHQLLALLHGPQFCVTPAETG